MSLEIPVELLTIGREILDGRVVDTNAVRMAEIIRPLGLTPRFGQRVDDDRARILEAFKIAASRAKVILVTGGLGPTSDDITAEVFAEFLGETVVLNPEALKQVEAAFARFKITMQEVQKKQALLAPSCFVLKNTEGTAPGFGANHKGVAWYFMPGVPREMEAMLKNEVLPKLPKSGTPLLKTWATQFTSEGKLQESLTAVERKLPPGFEITYRTKYPENHIGLYVNNPKPNEKEIFKALCQEITEILGTQVFTAIEGSLETALLEEVVLQLLIEKDYLMATVESCTGGLVAHRITNVSGSSKVFWGSVVSYDNSAKQNILGVPEVVLKSHGAVSRETAKYLAEGGLRLLKQSKHASNKKLMVVATTGIAGPDGGTPEKPVGLCYLGLAREGQPTLVEEVRGRPGLDRHRNKLLFSQKALDFIRVNILN